MRFDKRILLDTQLVEDLHLDLQDARQLTNRIPQLAACCTVSD